MIVKTDMIGLKQDTETKEFIYRMGEFEWNGLWYYAYRDAYGRYTTGCTGQTPVSQKGGRILMSDGTYDYF